MVLLAAPAFTGAVDFTGTTSVDFTGATVTGLTVQVMLQVPYPCRR